MVRNREKYDCLLLREQMLEPLPTSVTRPCNEPSLAGAVGSARWSPIAPLLVRPEAKINAVAERLKVDLSGLDTCDVPLSQTATAQTVELVREGRAETPMKGSLHSDELMGEVVKRDTELRTARRISH